MARNGGWGGPPDDQYPNDEPTAYLGPPVEDEPEVPWYRKPAALVAFGALGAVLIALIVYGLAKAVMGDDAPSETTSLTPLTTTSRSVAPPAQSRETVTETVTPTTTAPTTTTTTEPTTTTTTPSTTTTTTEPTTSVSTSTSTVTETVTAPPSP